MINNFKETIKNPYYFTLLLVVLSIFLIFYSYNILDQPFACHIKFFVYNYVILSLLFLFYNSILEDSILLKHGLKKNNNILDEINTSIENYNTNQN
jgi:hypothetical protein